jgi:hypothetical protein
MVLLEALTQQQLSNQSAIQKHHLTIHYSRQKKMKISCCTTIHVNHFEPIAWRRTMTIAQLLVLIKIEHETYRLE